MSDLYPKLISRSDGAPNQELKIVWSDEKEIIYKFKELRYACQCAMCRHEITGEKLIQIENISSDINLLKAELVGNYAIHFQWSDGHNTGIYSYDYLRTLK